MSLRGFVLSETSRISLETAASRMPLNDKNNISPDGIQEGLVWRFGSAEFDESRWQLKVAGQVVELEPRPLALLQQLLRKAGELLTHDELLDAVYGRRHITEGVIANAVAKLRKALGDEDRKLIVTVPRIGYRLAGRVTSQAPSSPPAPTLELKAGDVIPHRPHWNLVKPLGSGGTGGDTWLGEQGKSRERRVFKFASTAAQLDGLKREITLSRVLRDNLGPRTDFARVLDWNLEATPCFIELAWEPAGNLIEWATAQQGLAAVPLATRLELAAQIAEALTAAHSVGVLHKDLKPSNVLLAMEEGRPRVRLADFGSGRMLDDAYLAKLNITRMGFTRLGLESELTSGTPMYLAPELIEGQSPTVQADIYALGVMLYQLVVGDFRRLLAPGWEHGVADELLREDIAAAAAGDPARRLADAAQLAQRLRNLDVRRAELERQRQEQERSERQRQALARSRRRRRWLSLVAATSLLGLAGSLWYAYKAQRARADEAHQAQRALQMQSFLFRLFKMANADHTGKPVTTVPELLQLGLERLPAGVNEAGDRRQLQLGLAESLYLSGNLDRALSVFLQVALSAAKDGDRASEVEAKAFAGVIEIQKNNVPGGRALEAQALADARGKDIPPRARVLSEVFYAFNEDSNGYRTDANLALLRAAAKEARDANLDRDDQAQALSYLAQDLDLRGGHTAEVKALDQQLLALYGDDPLNLCERSVVYGQLAWIDSINGDPQGSLPLFQRAYDGSIACAGPDSTEALNQLPYWSDALMRTGRVADALALLEKAMPTWRRLVGNNPDYADMLLYLSRAYLANGRSTDAEQAARDLLILVEPNLAPGDRSIGSAHLVMGQALTAQHKYKESQPHAEVAARILVHATTPYGRQWDEQAALLQQQVKAALQNRD
jgi:DNA-binding winged helix-turn-helix (wHTH) protein/serine/threonine protein kinase